MNYDRKKHWYLGILGFIGFFELPQVISFFEGSTSAWTLLNLLWFLWFDYFLPTSTSAKSNS